MHTCGSLLLFAGNVSFYVHLPLECYSIENVVILYGKPEKAKGNRIKIGETPNHFDLGLFRTNCNEMTV